MLELGYIQLHRKMIKWEWYTDFKTTHLFIHCLLTANYYDNKHKGMLIKRGSFITSYEKLKEETGLGIQSIRTSLKKLELTQEVTRIPTNTFTHITICNYNSYQTAIIAANMETNMETNKRLTNDQHVSNKVKKELIIYLQGYFEILKHLNKKTGSDFKPGPTKALYQIIIDNGFTNEDFIIVIDKMADLWIGTKYVNGLRPETLFKDPIKFEGYLNQRNYDKPSNDEDVMDDDEQYL